MGHAARLTPKYIAIARVNSDSTFVDGSATLTLSYTVGAGSDRLMVAGAVRQNGTPWVSFTFNGDAGTLDEQEVDTASTNNSVLIASLVNPDIVGAEVKTVNGLALASVKTVKGLATASVKTINGLSAVGGSAVVTKSNASDRLSLSVANYTGADQTGQPDAVNSANTASASSLSYTVTTVQDNCWIMSQAAGTQADLVGTTNFTVLETPSAAWIFGDSNGSVGAAGGKTVAMTMTSGRIWSASAAYSPS